jgi:hypothetical protein
MIEKLVPRGAGESSGLVSVTGAATPAEVWAVCLFAAAGLVGAGTLDAVARCVQDGAA